MFHLVIFKHLQLNLLLLLLLLYIYLSGCDWSGWCPMDDSRSRYHSLRDACGQEGQALGFPAVDQPAKEE